MDPIGVVLLDSYCSGVAGDTASADTYSHPVLFEEVRGCTVERLIVHGDPEVEADVVAACRRLEAAGAIAITSGCGFFLRHQRAAAGAVRVPVMLSSLLQLPMLAAATGGRVGVVTATARYLTDDVLGLAGVDRAAVAVAGMDDSPEFCRGYMGPVLQPVDVAEVERETVEVARSLVETDPDIGAVLIECAVLPTYAHAVQSAVGLPVFDFLTMLDYWLASFDRQPYLVPA
jgi:Asp/Glu/hydantoin racemase